MAESNPTPNPKPEPEPDPHSNPHSHPNPEQLNFGVRRLNIGGKIMTNHLKQVVSYRAYNVMDETHLINDIKERP